MIITSHIASSRLSKKNGSPAEANHRPAPAPSSRNLFSLVVKERKNDFDHRFVGQGKLDPYIQHFESFKDWRMPEQPVCYIKAKRHGLL
jgi:hypothetical protein